MQVYSKSPVTIRNAVKTGATVTSAAADPLFTITGGLIHIVSLVGRVTTVIQAQLNSLKIQAAIDDPAGDTDMSTAVDINADAVGTLYHFLGPTGILTPVTAGLAILDQGHATLAPTQWIMTPGDIEAIGSAASTGNVEWSMAYIPLSPSSKVAVAA